MLQRCLTTLLILALGWQGAALCAADTPFAATAKDEFLPVEQAYRLAPLLDGGELLLHWEIADDYYLYRHGFEVTLTQNGTAVPISTDIAPGLAKHDEYFGDVEVYYGQAEVAVRDLPGSGSYHLTVTSQGCADAGLCYPPYSEHFRLDLDRGEIAAAAAPARTAQPTRQVPPAAAPRAGSLGWYLLLALAGGIILNLMPCVFPVLSLKVLGFANDRGHSQSLQGLSYTAGVVLSFLLVAALLIALQAAGRAVGWGFQLQSPWFVGVLAYLFFTMGLSLSGVIHFGGSLMNIGNTLASRSGYSGSFFTGVLATLVASPCTAPFMGTALGFAATQPPVTALAIFGALGLGMALPVLLLCFSPRLLRLMPRPGPWMERFKQLLAFPLYATAIWLAWVVGRQAGVNAMAALLAGCVLIAFALWLWPRGLLGRGLGAAGAALALALLAAPLFTPRQAAAPVTEQAWRPYDATTLAALRAEGEPVFVNITADWCITCLANERITLSTDAVQQALRERGVVYLKGDWTNYDPRITALLKRYQRNGIPLYLLYPRGPGDAIVLPQILSKGLMIDALSAI